MEYRQLGNAGLRVPVLCFGTATFGGGSDFFKAWGSTQADEATRLVNLCLDAGVNLFDTANVVSPNKFLVKQLQDSGIKYWYQQKPHSR